MKRASLYVDGFNFYYGVTKYWRDQRSEWAGLGWCDFRALIERNGFLGSDECLTSIEYFTAPVTDDSKLHDSHENDRYDLWIKAVKTIPGLDVINGFYKMKDVHTPSNSDLPDRKREEKQTDVNLAIEVILDSVSPTRAGTPDHVFVLSADCDQMPTVFALLHRVSPPVAVTVLLPSANKRAFWEKRYRETEKSLLNASRKNRPFPALPGPELRIEELDHQTLANSLLRYRLVLTDEDGGRHAIECPLQWRLNPKTLDQFGCKRRYRPDQRPTHG